MTTTCSAGRGSGRFGEKTIDVRGKTPKRKTPISNRASEHRNETSQSLDWLGIISDGAYGVMCGWSMGLRGRYFKELGSEIGNLSFQMSGHAFQCRHESLCASFGIVCDAFVLCQEGANTRTCGCCREKRAEAASSKASYAERGC
jgi:hypothetical protein